MYIFIINKSNLFQLNIACFTDIFYHVHTKCICNSNKFKPKCFVCVFFCSNGKSLISLKKWWLGGCVSSIWLIIIKEVGMKPSHHVLLIVNKPLYVKDGKISMQHYNESIVERQQWELSSDGLNLWEDPIHTNTVKTFQTRGLESTWSKTHSSSRTGLNPSGHTHQRSHTLHGYLLYNDVVLWNVILCQWRERVMLNTLVTFTIQY